MRFASHKMHVYEYSIGAKFSIVRRLVEMVMSHTLKIMFFLFMSII